MSDNDNRFKNHLNRLPNTPLIYQAPTEGAVVKNLLLIDKAVADNKVFSTSVNSDTFPITYSYASDRSELLKALQSTFTTIDRIGIVSEGCNTRFLNMKSFFDNAQFLISVIKEFGVKNIDFLACSSLTNPEWVNFYTMLNTETGVVVGASNDVTGNIKYGGDWVMESTRQDIEFVYFTEGITYYQYLLAPVTIGDLTYNLDPVTLVATVVGFDVPPTNLVIPSIVNDKGTNYAVTTIGSGAFDGCMSLTSVTIPDSVTTIGASAFDGCTTLESVTIGTGVTTIENYAFYNCTTLTQFTVTNNPNFYAYSGVLFSGTVNNSPSTLIQYPIGKPETTYIIPSNVTTIGEAAFETCASLESVTIPSNVTTIGAFAFSDCTSLTSITIPDSVTTIGYAAFYDCTKLTSVTIPDSVTTIGGFAFSGCTSLTSVTIGTGVTTIGYAAFESCTSLTSVTIPDSVKNIGDFAFVGCTILTTYKFIGNPPILGGSDVFGNGPTSPAAKVYYYVSEWPLTYGDLDTVGLSPEAPTNLKVSPDAIVSWTASTGASSYTVTATGGATPLTQTTSTTSVKFQGLTIPGVYTFTVVATNSHSVLPLPSSSYGPAFMGYAMGDMFSY